MKKAFFNWSTGKDSALALYKILQDKNYSIDKLVTSVNENFSRVLMHGVQEELLNQQAESIGLPLEKIYFPEEVSMEFYGEIMKKMDIMAEANSPQKKNFSWIKSLILRDVIRRSAKHIFNDTMRELPEYLVKEYTAYFLNILLAPSNLIKNLEGQRIEYTNGTIQSTKQTSNVNQINENKNFITFSSIYTPRIRLTFN